MQLSTVNRVPPSVYYEINQDIFKVVNVTPEKVISHRAGLLTNVSFECAWGNMYGSAGIYVASAAKWYAISLSQDFC